MTIESLVRAIEAEFEVALGRPERVRAAVDSIRSGYGEGEVPAEAARLVALLEKRSGRIAAALFPLVADFAMRAEDPWPWLQGMLRCRDRQLRLQSLDLADRLAGDGRLAVDETVVSRLASGLLPAGGEELDGDCLDRAARLVGRYSAPPGMPGDSPPVDLYLNGRTYAIRRLAAAILDRSGQRIPSARVERLIGRDAARFLGPHLAYAGATHSELLDLAPPGGLAPETLDALQRAESICGERLLREAIARVGWGRVAFGLESRKLIEIRREGSLPLYVAAEQLEALRSLPGASLGEERYCIATLGGRLGESPTHAERNDAVARFRDYNLAHAEALAEFLSLSALTREQVERIRDSMDRIVGDFVGLFGDFDEECARLPERYAELRARISELLAAQEGDFPLSLELTRRIQMFEDPRHLGEVTTLHGLKRYLHQKGLQLGFRLVEGDRATNRTLDLIVASRDRILAHARAIQYIDFEPPAGEPRAVPYAVRIVAEGLLLHLLHGGASTPEVKAFCYGNEVHYYVAYGSHPAFLRIDFAPPLRGGMIDLEYYGVSKNELETHPAPDLPAIRRFLGRLEFDCTVSRTRIHVRYDKERALDLSDLCAHAESLFRLLPHLMDLDWVIGSLRLDEPARRLVSDAWAERFAAWGALPIAPVLTADRLGILERLAPEPSGDREIAWSGLLPYRDRFPAPPPEGFSPFSTAGLFMRREGAPTAGIERAAAPTRFAEILTAGGEALVRSIRLARLILPLERGMRFRTTGSVQGYEVQTASMALLGEEAVWHVLRDAAGVIRLALLSRCDTAAAGDGACEIAPGEAASILRSLRYLTAGADPIVEEGEPEQTRRLFRERSLHPPPRALPGERTIGGVRASPGRTTGIVRLGTSNRRPEELEGAILVAALLRPEDNAHLYHAAGIVTTGGGILSHAGLLALQFRKPAMMIEARWDSSAPPPGELLYRATDFREERERVGDLDVVVRHDLIEREERLRDGDLATLDVEEGSLRILGQEPDAIALHDGLRGLAEAGHNLSREQDAGSLLEQRGRRLRLLHQMERLFARLRDPVLVRYAVEEILFSEGALEGLRGEKEKLLSLLLDEPEIGESARAMIETARCDLERIWRTRELEAATRIPAAEDLYEVISLRLEALRPRERLAGIAAPAIEPSVDLDSLARERLRRLRADLLASIEEPPAQDDPTLRHRLRRIARINSLLGARPDPLFDARLRDLERFDRARLAAASGLRILRLEHGGEEIRQLTGSKASNLAEVERILGPGRVPDWFVVSDAAFREVLERPVGPGQAKLAQEIESVERAKDLSDSQKASRIRRLWEVVQPPWEIAREILAAYRALGDAEAIGAESTAGGEAFVAVRSSGREEDTETAPRAGEFETFLFIRGESELLRAIRGVWAGLWTSRAIHNRAIFGAIEGGIGGGVLVQRICWSRVSGVLQTIHLASRRDDEILLNAGLGIGEGIVSGSVEADWVVVEKTGDLARGPLRFRYATAEKREKVVFDERSGGGTIRVETLYHERLRPALEYAELLEVVGAAVALEEALGMPLDIEFAFEGSSLRLLQMRPVGALAACMEETRRRFPLTPEVPDAPCGEVQTRTRGGGG